MLRVRYSYSNKSNYVIDVFIFKRFTACSSIFYSFFLPPAAFEWAGFVVWGKGKKNTHFILFFFHFSKRRRTGEIKKLIFLSLSLSLHNVLNAVFYISRTGYLIRFVFFIVIAQGHVTSALLLCGINGPSVTLGCSKVPRPLSPYLPL